MGRALRQQEAHSSHAQTLQPGAGVTGVMDADGGMQAEHRPGLA